MARIFWPAGKPAIYLSLPGAVTLVIYLLSAHFGENKPKFQGLFPREILRSAVSRLARDPIVTRPRELHDVNSIFSSASTHENYNVSIIQRPLQDCRDREELLVLVLSHPNASRERQAIRDTWGSLVRGKPWPGKGRYQMKLVFVLGLDNITEDVEVTYQLLHSNSSEAKRSPGFPNQPLDFYNTQILPSLSHKIRTTNRFYQFISKNKFNSSVTQTEVKQNDVSVSIKYSAEFYVAKNETDLLLEILEFDDILLVDVVDSYGNLTRKMLAALHWVSQYCPGAQYLLKVDQDVFPHIPMIMTFLEQHGQINSIYGKVIPDGHIFREGRWAVSNESLPISLYPDYMSGNGYILSGDTVVSLLQLAPHFRYVPIEDAFITGILATQANISRVNVEGFTEWGEKRPHFCEYVNDRRFLGTLFEVEHLQNHWQKLLIKGGGRCDYCRWTSWIVDAEVVFTGC